MKCAWKELLAIVPQGFRNEVDKQGREEGLELRLRLDKPLEIVTVHGPIWLEKTVTEEDLRFVVNAASQYSPWAAATIAKGYLTAAGGHRIGLCGEVYGAGGQTQGIRNITSLNIRIARDYAGLAPQSSMGNILVLGPPGSGKTTFLRDLARVKAQRHTVTVVDERGELFPKGFQQGKRMDILTGCEKPEGIMMALCTMGPEYIAVDEITQERDCQALLQASRCGVRLLATAHASDRVDLVKRPVYRQLAELNVFKTLVVLDQKKTWRMEKWEAAL